MTSRIDFNIIFPNGQGFNSTLTEPVETQGRRVDQIKEMEPKLHPELKEPLKRLCADPKTTIVVLSGSDRNVLDDVSSVTRSFIQILPYYVLRVFMTFHLLVTELCRLQYVVGSRKRNVSTTYYRGMDDNNA